MNNKELIIERLEENIDIIGEMVNDVNSYDGQLEDYVWYSHDEYFYEEFFASKDEVARAVYYGGNGYNYMGDYVRFNAYGNLETCYEYEREQELVNNVEEILDTWYELYVSDDVCDLSDDEIMELIKKGGREDE